MAEYSPMMQHYLATKAEYKDCILFYRLGDFYEMFFDDALVVSKELELTLTGKDCGQEERAPMCGVPFHAAETYINRLVSNGHKVAICEQMEDPKQAKGIVKREVIKVVTPGTNLNSQALDETKNNYLMSIVYLGDVLGVAIADYSTGDFFVTEIETGAELIDEINKFVPSEIILNEYFAMSGIDLTFISEKLSISVSTLENWYFDDDSCKAKLKEHFHVNMLDGLGIKDYPVGIDAAGALLIYLTQTQKSDMSHITSIVPYTTGKYMLIDSSSRRNLELVETMREKQKKGSLLWVLDKTKTAMGARALRNLVLQPLINRDEIIRRQDAIEELSDNAIDREEIREYLGPIYDLERIMTKISCKSANPRDLIAFKNSLEMIPHIKNQIGHFKCDVFRQCFEQMDDLKDLYNLVDTAIIDDPPITMRDGGMIKDGFSAEADELRNAKIKGKEWLAELESREKEKTGIKNLKIGFNKVFGYFIEVTKSYLDQVPDRFIRKQTLTNAERYITEDLKNLENQILGAEEKVINLEYNAFVEIREEISKNVTRLQTTSEVISSLDVLTSFAQVAEDFNYCMPVVDSSGTIDIKNGRHPVIEKILGEGVFVENDTFLDKGDNRLSIITGPNMAGKSTYMRQVALITLMAQCGSFVPAESANIGVVDKIFTRVGASDDLSMGQSTFMVEMMEVATILKEATPNSLVILDEIGRGTSTYDGLSIAWAVAEYIADKQKCGAKTLFATHYHELTELENKIEGIKNYSIAVKEKGEDIIFLRKIVRGGTDESYGIHVARLAGVPKVVTQKANEILRSLEKKNILTGKKQDKKQVEGQFDMYNYKLAEIAHEIDKVNLNELTPIDALNTLVRIKEKMK